MRRRDTGSTVADLLFVTLLLAFFAGCVAYVSWCDRMIGQDPLVDRTSEAGGSDEVLDPVGMRA